MWNNKAFDEAFCQIDKNKDGKLDKNEITLFLETLLGWKEFKVEEKIEYEYEYVEVEPKQPVYKVAKPPKKVKEVVEVKAAIPEDNAELIAAKARVKELESTLMDLNEKVDAINTSVQNVP